MEDDKEITLKLKNKKFKDLKPWQKLVFFVSLFTMIGTLVYTGTHLDSLNVRWDTVNNYVTGCEMTFKNGLFDSVSCPNPEDEKLINISGGLTKEYTLNDYYSTVKENPFFNLTDWE